MDLWTHPSMRASKATPYDESAHIPFLIRWPGATRPGSRSPAFIGAIDLVPSLLGACGVPLPDGLQRRDISRVWSGESAPTETESTPSANDSVDLMNMGNAQSPRLGGSLARPTHGAVYLRPLVRAGTQPLAIRSA